MAQNKNTIFQVKSRNIVKKIFHQISDKKKASVALYNNKLKDILNIDLEFFKKTSGKYKIAPENGKGK